MPRYDPAVQLAAADPLVIAGFHRAADERNASDSLRLALFATGIVEANLRNPTGGDRDSVGSLQQRRGWGSTAARMDPHRAALAFLDDAINRVLPRNPDMAAGLLAQAVQRSAYPDRYDEAIPAARYVIETTRGDDGKENDTVSFANWQGARRCTNGPQPGARALMAAILDETSGARSLGIYNCRSVRGGSTTSLHGEGRALDVAMPMSGGRGSRAGWALVEQLRQAAGSLGIQAIIYDRRILSAKSPGKNGRHYGGVAPHYDHLHIELSWDAARDLTAAKARSILRGGGGQNPGSGELDGATYTVRPGDTLTEIARRVKGVSIEQIIEWNDIENPDVLSVGQVLVIEKKKEPKPDKSKGGGGKFAGYDHVPGTRLLREGSESGSPKGDVAYLQRMIGRQRCGPDDGLFGDTTASGVRWFQRDRGLAVDGLVGEDTWTALGVDWRG